MRVSMEENMLLKNKYANTRYSNLQEYYCDLTKELDSIIGLSQDQHWKHYILADDSMIKGKILAIRIPGGAIGGRYTFEFIPCSIGTIGTIKCGKCGEKFIFRELK